MTTDDFKKSLGDTFQECLEIVNKKNADYSGPDDPFRNFMLAETLGIPAEKAIVVRMADKMQRVANLLDRPGKVLDESVADTLNDLINYAAILKTYLRELSLKKPANTSLIEH